MKYVIIFLYYERFFHLPRMSCRLLTLICCEFLVLGPTSPRDRDLPGTVFSAQAAVTLAAQSPSLRWKGTYIPIIFSGEKIIGTPLCHWKRSEEICWSKWKVTQKDRAWSHKCKKKKGDQNRGTHILPIYPSYRQQLVCVNVCITFQQLAYIMKTSARTFDAIICKLPVELRRSQSWYRETSNDI